MNHLHRSITPRTLHLQRREAQGRDAQGHDPKSRANAGVTVERPRASALRHVVVPLNTANVSERAVPVAASSEPDGAARQSVTPNAASPVRLAPAAVDGSVSSENLLRGAKVVRILHNGESYQLRATRHGRLILTK